MYVELPTNGCNISQSSGYIDNYRGNIRTRYLIDENRLVKVYETSYNTQPTGYTCLHTGDIMYKPEIMVYFPILAGGMITLATAIILKIILGRILK